jgi:hypothetical protein
LVLLAAVGVTAPTIVRSQGEGTPNASATAKHRSGGPPTKQRGGEPMPPDEASTKVRALLEGYLAPKDGDLSEAVRRYRQEQRGQVFTLIATVPDPNKSDFDAYFDQEIDSIRGAARSAKFMPDRFSLQWKDASPDTDADLDLDLDLAAEPPKGTGKPQGGPADRYRLKHHEDDAAERLPGLMLFRRPARRADPTAAPAVDLLVVLLVGETPTEGINRRALKAALTLSDQLRSPARASHDLLAPFFSSSTTSLHLALEEHRSEHQSRSCQLRTTAISGSANGALRADGLGIDTTFWTTSHSAKELREAMLKALGAETANPSKVDPIAILAEGTAWGGTMRDPSTAHEAAPSELPLITWFEFPLHIAQLRSEREKVKQEAATEKTVNLRTKLELHLDHAQESVDEVSVRSALTPYGVELMLQQQLIAIARENFRYLGIAATDPADVIFLAGEARKYCPKVQLFTLGSNLLFTHPDVMRDLNGMLVASTYPLVGTRSSSTDPSVARLTFVSQEAEGVFNALSALLLEIGAQPDPPDGKARFLRDYTSSGTAGVDPPPVWISMVSNGAFWPFRSMPVDKNIMYPTREAAKSLLSSDAAWNAADTGAVDVFFVFLALGVTGLVVHMIFAGPKRTPRLRRPISKRASQPGPLRRGLTWVPGRIWWSLGGVVPSDSPDPLGAARSRYLLGIWFPISFVSAFLFAVFLHLRSDQPSEQYASLRPIAGGLLALLALVLTLTAVCRLVRDINRLRADRHAFNDAGLAGIGACMLLLGGGALAVRYLWSFLESVSESDSASHVTSLGIDATHLAIDRILQSMSGVSPALPVLFLAAGLCAWGYFGLRRVGEQAQFPDSTPFPPAEGLASTGLGALAESVRANRTARLLTREHGAGLFVTSGLAIYFIIKLRPTLEGGSFDWLFLTGFVVLLLLVVANAGRTVAAWLELRRLLRRLAGHPMADAYDRVGAGATRAVEVELGARVPHPDELEGAVRMGELLARDPPPFAKAKAVEVFQQRLRDEVELARRAYTQEIDTGAVDVRIGTQAALFRLARLIFGMLERLWAGDAAPDSPKSIEHVVDDVIPAEAQTEGPYRHVHTLALYRRLAAPTAQIWQRLAEDLVASQVVTLVKLGLGRIRSMMTFGVIGALLLVCAVSAYPFQPARFATLFAWTTALSVMGAVLWVVIGLERDEILSRIAQTRPGHIEMNTSLLARLALYGGVPVVALVATNFPQVGAVVFSWIEPLMRALH